MKDKNAHPIRNGIIATVIGGAILSFWPPFRDLLLQVVISAWSISVGVWNYLSSTHHVYGWLLLILLSLSVPTIIRVGRRLIPKQEPTHTELYTQDFLFGAKWRWGYVDGSIVNLWCLCPQCQSELVYAEHVPNPYRFKEMEEFPRTEFICERCRVPRATLEGKKSYALGTVEREIRRKIRTGEWKPEQSSS
ncbi:hypothetical protein LRB11_16040 [Ectothiorhodospira haloalkaliphila]|uniref:hypothetical protein n=1 Tax=Ectothiorhodospira haloalkaliphila TaxID=421628 RepID=UPI001EE87AA4|nr:hypothetical protein [Ectothiorhodospira haloalkaliphila]MCG5526417.1 hypothetical protein [Ectothiorhodospira haloalkaliphila]